jgi:Xaa-Pro aminopeptidase
MAELRLIKSPLEQDIMRQSARIASDAHVRAMRFTRPGRYEYQVAAELHHEFAMQGAAAPAYSTICGSGENACILHYTSNQSELTDGDLLLIDAGCEYQGYASDISRTFPVNGRFSPAQARVYEWVLKAQRAAIDVIRPGATLPEAYAVAAEILTEGLIDLGVLKGSVEDNLKTTAYRPYFMHGLGHWLGLDVHDAGAYQTAGKARPLQAGMVLTIEPGLYIPPQTECDPAYQGVGVRIEDDIVVTADGHENLTAAVPVAIDEIERLMQSTETETS